ncbi:MAG TPA: serine hydrolase, partial [Pyrinomonadaceae bacterium]|nr:serine hydrolase [Pyrinomonadaceae bacterium]
NQHSPIRDQYPNGHVFSLEQLIKYAVSESDGTASDVLMRIAGGADVIQKYVENLGIPEMKIKNTEKEIGEDWSVQYDNWASPEGAAALLKSLWGQKEPCPKGADCEELLLLQFMYNSTPGKNRLKGLLPERTPVAHKTGTSGTRAGVTAATNDIGIITLPNGNHLAIAVFVGDSSADEKTREVVIARIAKAAWNRWGATSVLK